MGSVRFHIVRQWETICSADRAHLKKKFEQAMEHFLLPVCFNIFRLVAQSQFASVNVLGNGHLCIDVHMYIRT